GTGCNRIGKVLEYFERVVNWGLDGTMPIPIADIIKAIRATQLAWKHIADNTQHTASSQCREGIKVLNTLSERIESADFAVRLKRWAGRLTHDDYEQETDEDGQVGRRYNIRLQILAQEVKSDPSLLTNDLLRWLCSREAEMGPQFAYWLGS